MLTNPIRMDLIPASVCDEWFKNLNLPCVQAQRLITHGVG